MLVVVARALPPRAEAALDPFVKGMRRRLGRDQDRLHRYHNDVYHEATRRALALHPDDPKRLREEQRAAAIQREYRARLAWSSAPAAGGCSVVRFTGNASRNVALPRLAGPR